MLSSVRNLTCKKVCFCCSCQWHILAFIQNKSSWFLESIHAWTTSIGLNYAVTIFCFCQGRHVLRYIQIKVNDLGNLHHNPTPPPPHSLFRPGGREGVDMVEEGPWHRVRSSGSRALMTVIRPASMLFQYIPLSPFWDVIRNATWAKEILRSLWKPRSAQGQLERGEAGRNGPNGGVKNTGKE